MHFIGQPVSQSDVGMLYSFAAFLTGILFSAHWMQAFVSTSLA